MSNTKEKTTSLTFKIGDEIWWFKVRSKNHSSFGLGYNSQLSPDEIELVHDVITDIQDDTLICWHGSHHPRDVWGKSRSEAWSRLKKEIEKWGSVE